MPWDPPRRDFTRARRGASSARARRRGRPGEGEEDESEPVEGGAEPPGELIVSRAVVDQSGREGAPRGHRAGQREEQPGEARRVLAPEEVGDRGGEERGAAAVGEPEEERRRIERGQLAGMREADERGDLQYEGHRERGP